MAFRKLPIYYIVVHEEYDKYRVDHICITLEEAKKALYEVYMSTILRRNVYGSLVTSHMIVLVDDLVKAIEHRWQIIVKSHTQHDIDDIKSFNVNKHLLEKFQNFQAASKEYVEKRYSITPQSM